MRNASLGQVKAPSLTLLKFLRAQNAGVAFFTSNALSKAARPSPASQIPCMRNANTSRPHVRLMTTATPSLIPLSASIFSLDALWPKRRTQNLTPSGHGPGALATSGSCSTVSGVSTPFPIASISRSASSSSNSRDYRRFWRFGNPKKDASVHSNDIPQLAHFLDDNASLGRIVRAGNELKLRCTEFDVNGNVTLVNGEFKKTELIAKYGLLPRDLRKIDSSLLPHILVRPSAILINLLHLRVLIKHDRVLVFDAYGSTDSYTQSLFMYDLEGKLRTGSNSGASHLPYEFRALEAVLISVTSGLESEFEGVRGPVVRVLRELEEDIDRDKLRHLLIYSKKLSSFEQKARLVRDSIDDILEADDDLAAMYLTEKATTGLPRPDEDHTEIEMLLESYHKVCDEIVQVSGNLVSNIRNTEEVVRAILDANRNELMLLDIKFSIGTLGLGGGTFVAALYGMNLKNFIEESDFGFWGVSAWCTVFSIFVLMWGMRKLKRTERLSMWGSGEGRKGWASLGERPSEAVMGQMRRERLRAAKEMRDMKGAWLGEGTSHNGAAPAGHMETSKTLLEEKLKQTAMAKRDKA